MIQLFVYNNNSINKEGAIIIQITAIFFGGLLSMATQGELQEDAAKNWRLKHFPFALQGNLRPHSSSRVCIIKNTFGKI